MELLKDYDCTILYHLDKPNVVTDTLSRKFMGSLAHIVLARRSLMEEIHKLEFEHVHFKLGKSRLLLAHVHAQSSLIEPIKTVQYDDPRLCKLMDDVCNAKKS